MRRRGRAEPEAVDETCVGRRMEVGQDRAQRGEVRAVEARAVDLGGRDDANADLRAHSRRPRGRAPRARPGRPAWSRSERERTNAVRRGAARSRAARPQRRAGPQGSPVPPRPHLRRSVRRGAGRWVRSRWPLSSARAEDRRRGCRRSGLAPATASSSPGRAPSFRLSCAGSRALRAGRRRPRRPRSSRSSASEAGTSARRRRRTTACGP